MTLKINIKKFVFLFKLHFFIFLSIFTFFLFFTKPARLATLVFVSDTVSNSAPNENANHLIKFTNTAIIPPSGKIIITPESEKFLIPVDLDYTDIDFLVDDIDYPLALTPGTGLGANLGVEVIACASGKITFTLNNSESIPAGSVITVKIGTNAVFGEAGNQQIINSQAFGSFRMRIRTENSSGIELDSAGTMIAIIKNVYAGTPSVNEPSYAPDPWVCDEGGGDDDDGGENDGGDENDNGDSSGGGGGGGGGGGSISPVLITAVNISGKAYPLSKVTILKDGQTVTSTIAGPDAAFNVSVSGLNTGNYVFVVQGEDNKENFSKFTFPVYITTGTTINITGIFLAPTIDVDKSEVVRGENIAIFGQSVPEADMTIVVNSNNDIFLTTKTDKDGIYLYNFDTVPLELGEHTTKAKAAIGTEISSFSELIGFKVGEETVFKQEDKCQIKANLNNDCRVNLVDFSILAYWYKRPSFPAEIDISGDGKINLVDFSIMAYYWTG